MRRRALSSICRSSRRSARRSPPAPRGGPSNWPSSPSGAARTSARSTWGRGSAKLPNAPASSSCTAHGIRKAAARRLAEAGATVNQLMAIFGWTRPDMAIKYTREANKKLMAAGAIGGLVRSETENVYSLTAILGEGTVAETGAVSIS